jgi:hypothetical protein
MNQRRHLQDRLGERLADEAKRCRAQASELPPGEKRSALLKKARQADTAAHINEWISSPGLKPPE